MDTLAFNCLLLLVDAALLVRLAHRPGPRNAAWVVFLSVVAPTALVIGLSGTVVFSLFRSMALLAWGVFLHPGLALLGVYWIHRRTSPRTATVAAVAAITLIGAAIDAFLVEPRWLEVNRHQLASEKIDRATRIVVLADLQTDDPGPYERRVVERALAEEPDLILMPGDYLQDSYQEFLRDGPELNRILHELEFRAPLGVYAVGGNTDQPDWPSVFTGLPVACFRDTDRIETDHVTITGLAMSDSFDREIRIPGADSFHIVVGHGPDFALSNDVDADLLIAGHCHGGQVRLPFFGPPITFSEIPRAWTDGLHEIRPGTWLSVSRGIGMERGEAPRLRFLCRPEIVVIDLVPGS